MKAVDLDHIKTRLSYDPQSGGLVWLPRPRSEFKTARAYLAWKGRFENKEGFTASTAKGYKVGRLDGVNLYAHRVAWAIHHGTWPEGEIDHINGDRTDNRIANLRAVSTKGNARNKRMDGRNRTGVTGVFWHKLVGKWASFINITPGKTETLGYFEDFKDAVKARKEAEQRHGYHENHGRIAA